MSETVTLATDTIHSPHDPRHFMALKPVKRLVRICRGDRLIADTRDALRLIEVGRGVYEPTLYIPKTDVQALLRKTDKTTRCPLKGDACYFDLMDEADEVEAAEIAWAYDQPFDFASDLAGRIAFYTVGLTVTEAPF
ncbi:MAG: DUF427 domain-containing protein [Pikeienuella sp.]